LGILNYVNKYILKLSEKIEAIRKHLNGGWSSLATKSVQQIKKEAQSLPKLKPPGTRQLNLHIDASDEYWGAVLLEKV